jgi:signal transduction histidine kinase
LLEVQEVERGAVARELHDEIGQALTNVARYVEASTVRVALKRTAQGLTIQVRDNGRGFDVAAMRERVRRGEALGIAGMEERVPWNRLP